MTTSETSVQAAAATDLPAQVAAATPPAGGLDIRPLMFEGFVCTIAMMSFVALIGPIARELGLAAWQAGTTVTVGGLAWMVCARLWGAASDRVGRRPIILSGVGGFVMSYAALCLFIAIALRTLPPVWMAFVGLLLLRGMVGAFYAAIPPSAAALIADHTPPHQRAGAMALLGTGSAAGMVVGPGLAGMLAVRGLSLPLAVTTVLPVISWLVLWRWLPRTPPQASTKPSPLKISDPRLRRPLTVAFVAMFTVVTAQVTVGFYAMDRLQLPAAEAARAAGMALTIVGVALILAQTLVRRLGWPPAKLIRSGGVVAALGFAATAWAGNPLQLWACYFVAAAGMGWVFPSVSALAANAVQSQEQGATAGTVAAAHGMGMILGPVVSTSIYMLNPGAPYLLVGVLLLLIALWPSRTAPVAG